MYEYRATLVAVVDGDTIHADVDLGFDVRERMTIRFYGVNAPEHGTPAGDAATAYVTAWFASHPVLVIQTIKDSREKYGRYLATIWASNGQWELLQPSLNAALVADGHAVAYFGGKR